MTLQKISVQASEVINLLSWKNECSSILFTRKMLSSDMRRILIFANGDGSEMHEMVASPGQFGKVSCSSMTVKSFKYLNGAACYIIEYVISHLILTILEFVIFIHEKGQ